MSTLTINSNSAAQFFTFPFRRRKQRYTINPPDENYNVIYLGNVLTIMAKGIFPNFHFYFHFSFLLIN